VIPFLIFAVAFWIVRRCARRWQTVFWQGGVYGTGAGLGTLALYTLTRVATADGNGVGSFTVWEGVPLATTVLVAVWPLGVLYLARGREAAEPASRRSLRRSVVGAYVTLALVAVWTAAWLYVLSLRHEAAAQRDPRALRAIAGSLWAQRDEHLAWALGGNVASPDDVPRQLASHPSSWVRAAVARNESASSEILAGLAGDAVPQVAAAVAANRRASPEQLRLLADPRAPDYLRLQEPERTRRDAIDRGLAANPATPQDVLELLVERWAPYELGACYITCGMVENPAVSDGLLRRIAELNYPAKAKALATLRRRGSDRATGGRN
jgi:hypothetical protein